MAHRVWLLNLAFAAAVAAQAPSGGPDRFELTGRVLDHAGAPLANVFVVIAAERPRYGCGVVTDAQGRFRAPNVPDTELGIRAGLWGYRDVVMRVSAPATRPLEIRLRPAGKIRGRIVGPNLARATPQEPLRGVYIMAWDARSLRPAALVHGLFHPVRTAEDGSFVLEGVFDEAVRLMLRSVTSGVTHFPPSTVRAPNHRRRARILGHDSPEGAGSKRKASARRANHAARGF
jgi:hypothetical protein